MDTKEDFFLSEEAAEWVGQKKSEYLSKLIMQLGADDFGFEEFHLFDHLVPQTLEAPDRSFEERGDTFLIRTYVRSYHNQQICHHIVVGGVIPDQQGSEVFVPVISFVTKKLEVVSDWSKGEPLSRPTLN